MALRQWSRNIEYIDWFQNGDSVLVCGCATEILYNNGRELVATALDECDRNVSTLLDTAFP